MEEATLVRPEMQQIALAHRRRYGYRRITAELRRRGLLVNHKRVARLIREDNLLAVQPRAFVVTTEAQHDLAVYLTSRPSPDSDRDQSALGGRYHVLSPAHRVRRFARDLNIGWRPRSGEGGLYSSSFGKPHLTDYVHLRVESGSQSPSTITSIQNQLFLNFY